MTTMLLMTGVHIGAAKWPRALRIAAGQRAHPVEEDLRDEEVGEDHHQVALRPGDGVRVQVHQQAGGQRGHHRQDEQRDRGQGEHPLVVGLAAVGVPLGRADQQRDHHAGQDAAEHQVVHRVGQRVGVVVGVGHAQSRRARRPASACAGSRCRGRPGCPTAITVLERSRLAPSGPGGGPAGARLPGRRPGRPGALLARGALAEPARPRCTAPPRGTVRPGAGWLRSPPWITRRPRCPGGPRPDAGRRHGGAPRRRQGRSTRPGALAYSSGSSGVSCSRAGSVTTVSVSPGDPVGSAPFAS